MEAVQDFPECDKCLELQFEIEQIVLCPKCERQILPQLKEPSWTRLIGFTNPEDEKEPEPDAPTAKARRRNDRKYGRLASKDDDLTCHFCAGGCSTPVRTQGLMCGPCGEDRRSRKPLAERTHYTGMNGQ